MKGPFVLSELRVVSQSLGLYPRLEVGYFFYQHAPQKMNFTL